MFMSDAKRWEKKMISFIVGLLEEGVSYLLLHSIWCEMLLWLKCIKKMKLHIDKKLEKEDFNSLLDNCVLFFDTTTKLNK